MGNYMAVSPDSTNSAIADAECFMEIGVGFIQSNTSADFIPVRLLFDSASNGSYGR